MNALVTGSRVYGTPHANSDIDLVVLVDADAFQDWIDGTNELKTIKPVTREKSVEVFDRYRNARKEKRAA